MRLSVIAILTATSCVFGGQALANDYHQCGDIPDAPELFDPKTAEQDDLRATANAFKAYQDVNGTFLDCLDATKVSDAIQGINKKSEKKRAMKALEKDYAESLQNENDFADGFMSNQSKWRKRKEKELAKLNKDNN